MHERRLSCDDAKRMFRYDKRTGKLFWREIGQLSRHIAVGDEVGTTSYRGTNGAYRTVVITGYGAYLVHRIIWLIVRGKWPDNQLDHEDGDGLNNRLRNLREADDDVNSKNMPLRCDNRTGCPGVHRRRTNWFARICVHGKIINIGTFNSVSSAVRARKAAERRYGFHKNHGRRAASCQ